MATMTPNKNTGTVTISKSGTNPGYSAASWSGLTSSDPANVARNQAGAAKYSNTSGSNNEDNVGKLSTVAGSTPAAPKVNKKAKAQAEAEALYLKQANAWNAAVDAYNSKLTKYNDTYSSLLGKVNGLNIDSFWDNPATAVNENPYSTLLSGMNSLESGLWGLNLGMERPTFQSTIQTADGPITISNLPSLRSANTALYNTLMGNVGRIGSRLDGLMGQRRAEEDRVKSFAQSLLGDISPLQSMADSLTIADLDQINNLNSQLSGLRSRAKGFSSSILNQLMPGGFADFNSIYDATNQRLGKLRSDRTAEEARIRAFEQSLYSNADLIQNRLGGLTIADLDAMNSTRSELDRLYQDAGRFESLLPYDFTQEMGSAGLGAARSRLEQLFTDRTAEEARIRQTEADFRNRSRNLSSLANGLSLYNLDNINEAKQGIADLRGEATGFSSLLPFNFNDGDLSGLDTADTQLAKLMTDRQAKLADLQSRAGAPTTGIEDIALSDEATLQSRAKSIDALMRELGMFTGSDTADLQALLTGADTSVDNRLAELATYRGNLETQAQELMKRVQDATYYQSAGLSADEAALQQMRDQIKLYNAQQAMDELTAIEQRLGGERSRLVADEGAAAERQRAAQAAVMASLGGQGVPQFQNYIAVNPQLAALYGRQFQRPAEDERLMAPVSASTFSNYLGLGG